MSARILLIEDNPANLDLMNYLLVAFGYSPVLATDGAMGLARAGEMSFDLIICDIHMPILDGYQVARTLKDDPRLRRVPIVAVTALAMVGDRDKVLSAGFDGYITKPIDPETFVRSIESYLRIENRFPSTTNTEAQPIRPASVSIGKTILAVDNLTVNLELARSILEPFGYRVVTAESMDEGLVKAREIECDLILSDVCMTGGSGFHFIRALKADPVLAGIPLIFITSTFRDPKDRQAGLALGAEEFLFRPIEPEILLAEIEKCLRKSAKEVEWPGS